MRRKQIVGQMTIEEYLESLGAKAIASGKLFDGQIVFFVNKANISKYEVFGTYMVYDEETVVLISKDMDVPFRTIQTEDIGHLLFESMAAAQKEVQKNREKYDCILTDEMHIVSYKTYAATQKKDNALLLAFYAVLDNGYVYLKDYFSCGHLIKASKEDADTLLEEAIGSYGIASKEVEVMPILQNMYKIKSDKPIWEYAELSFAEAIA